MKKGNYRNQLLQWFAMGSVSFLLSLTFLLTTSCERTSDMDYVPSPEQIKNTLSEFLIDEHTIQGLYGNMDVDSMIFRYTPKITAQTTAEEILRNTITKAQKENWKLVEEKPGLLRFHRLRPMGRFFSAEEVRVRLNREKPTIYVAWVQADSTKPISTFEEAGSGAKFAKKVIWPMLESYVEERS